jgi:hypothetical protein
MVSPYLEKPTTDPSLDPREPTRTIAAIGARLLQWMEDNDAGKRRVVLDPNDVRAIRARAYTLRHIAIEHNETLKQVYECLVAFAACMPNDPIESRIAGIVNRLLIQLEPYKPKE